MRGQAGFTLLEAVCVLALVALLAAIALPAIPGGTSQQRLAGYAIEIAALLKSDRNAAILNGAAVSTSLSASARAVTSGASGRVVQLPADVAFDAILAQRCGARRAGTTIDFFPGGGSCGGTIAIARNGTRLQIRVNWLTGGVEIVPSDRA
jgi:general secretion pathway protein H